MEILRNGSIFFEHKLLAFPFQTEKCGRFRRVSGDLCKIGWAESLGKGKWGRIWSP